MRLSSTKMDKNVLNTETKKLKSTYVLHIYQAAEALKRVITID